MQHNEANTKIYFTRDYGVFKSVSGNRDLNPGKIKRIIHDIENGLDMLRYCPIIVDKDMNVIDGQHRLYVASKIKSNVWYVISDTLDLIDIARLNSNTEKWKAKDFLNCYVVKGIQDYMILENFVKKYEISIGIGFKLLMSGEITSTRQTHVKTKPAFERGEFKADCLEYATRLMDTVNLFSQFGKCKTRDFINAIHHLLQAGKADIGHLVKNFQSDPTALDRCDSTKDYMLALEQIYNYRKKERHIIF